MHEAPIRIVLVEDNPADARLVELLLGEAAPGAAEVTRAGTMREARAHLARAAFDLVLLDLCLPDSRGLETVRAMADADAAVVVLSGLGDDPATALEAVRLGADECLHKDGLQAPALLRVIRHAIERRRKQGHARFLAEALHALAGELDRQAILRTLAHLLVPSLADWCIVEVHDGRPGARIVEMVAADPARADLLREKLDAYPHETRHHGHPVAEVLRTGAPRLVAAVDAAFLERIAVDARHRALLERLAARSMVVVPLVARGSTIGALTLATAGSGRRLDRSDLALASEVARVAALPVDNARRYTDALRAERRAITVAERSHRLESVSSGLSAALTPEEVAGVAMREGLQAAGTTAGTLLTRDGLSGALRPLASAGVPPEALAALGGADDGADSPSPAAEVLRRGEPVFARDRAALASAYPAVAHALGTALDGGMLALPLRHEDSTVGVIVFFLSTSPPPRDGAYGHLRRCADRCASALDRALAYERERSARAEALEATRLRDEVLGIVAHDLRNPLGAITAYASLLEDDAVGAQQRRYAGSILRVAGQMDALIQDLLTVSSLEAGKLDLHPVPARVCQLVEAALWTTKPAAAEKELALEVELCRPLPPVLADRERVLQVFGNVLGNAVKFTPAGGRITVRAERVGDEVRLQVRDTGPGIAPENLAHVFDRFWQVRTARRGGAGLGLAIARGIVERHGGRMGVESPPGGGSTFFFTLPTAPGAASAVDAADDVCEADLSVVP